MNRIRYVLLLLLLPTLIMAENATNVRVRQQGKDIIVTYDLLKTSNVRLLMSTGGSPYQVLKAVEGDYGKHIRAGENLTIIWHPLQEKDRFIADNVRFQVEALGSYEQYALPRRNGRKTDMETFILGEFAYSFTPETSFGLMFGQTYKYGLGWFVDCRSNFHFPSATNGLSCKEGGYVDDVLPFYSGKTTSSVLTAHAGLVLDILELSQAIQKNRFNTFGFYAGLGYGWRELYWETIDGQKIKYDLTSSRGFSGNIGILGSIYGLTLKAGINTINFQYVEIEVGLGWMF